MGSVFCREPSVTYLDRVRAHLHELGAQALLRVPRRNVPGGALDFASNDYLGLGRDPRLIAAQRSASVAGSGGSRLLSGAHLEHAELEDALAAWTGRERALLFSSGYLAALGAIVTLAPFTQVAYSDALVHACAIDALRLTKLPRYVVPHGTLPARHERADAALIITESLFGMDGSLAPLDALVAALRCADVLVVDEAHALGVRGRHGAGLAASFADERVIIIGTLSKALGTAGGFVAGPRDAIALLASTARTFVFDTAAPPAVVAAACASLAIVRGREGDDLRNRLATNAERLRHGLCKLGFPSGELGFGIGEVGLAADARDDGSFAANDDSGGRDADDKTGAIVPLIVGSAGAALAFAGELEARGIFAPAIRPPTVPQGTARLRFVVRADHTDEQIDVLLEALAAVATAPA